MRRILALILGMLLGLSACSGTTAPSIPFADASQGAAPQAAQPSFPSPASKSESQTLAGPKAPDLPGRAGPDQTIRLLGTKEELLDFAQWVGTGASYYRQDLTWRLDGDIDLGGEPWLPIGPFKNVISLEDAEAQLEGYDYLLETLARQKEEDPEFYEDVRACLGFFGAFDGDGHRITGLNVPYDKSYTSEEDNTQNGFFATLGAGAQVYDLHIEGTVQGFGDTGGLAGQGPPGTFVHNQPSTVVSGCSFTGTVELGGTAPSDVYSSPGGFGGLIGSTGKNLQMTRCFAHADVSGDYDVGGLVGSANNGSLITDCYSRGTVTAVPHASRGEEGLPVSHIGGLAGGSYNGTFINCYSDTFLIITAASGPVGGLVGYYSGRDYGCAYSAEKTGAWGPGSPYAGSNTEFTALALTQDEMKDAQTFLDLGWDMTTVWQLEEGDAAPTLRR